MSAQGHGNGMLPPQSQGLQSGNVLQGGMQPGMQPPGASFGGGNAQMPPQMMPPAGQAAYGMPPPRQANGPLPPMGQPMVDPTSAGGFFGHPNHGGMPRPGFPYQR